MQEFLSVSCRSIQHHFITSTRVRSTNYELKFVTYWLLFTFVKSYCQKNIFLNVYITKKIDSYKYDFLTMLGLLKFLLRVYFCREKVGSDEKCHG